MKLIGNKALFEALFSMTLILLIIIPATLAYKYSFEGDDMIRFVIFELIIRYVQITLMRLIIMDIYGYQKASRQFLAVAIIAYAACPIIAALTPYDGTLKSAIAHCGSIVSILIGCVVLILLLDTSSWQRYCTLTDTYYTFSDYVAEATRKDTK